MIDFPFKNLVPLIWLIDCYTIMHVTNTIIIPQIIWFHVWNPTSIILLLDIPHNLINDSRVPTLSLFWWKYTMILIKLLWRTLMVPRLIFFTNYMGSGTCWIDNRKDEHSIEKRNSTYSNKKIWHIITPFIHFFIYSLCPCQQSNIKPLCISQLWFNSQYHRKTKMISIFDLGSNYINYANTHCLGSNNNILELAKFEKYHLSHAQHIR